MCCRLTRRSAVGNALATEDHGAYAIANEGMRGFAHANVNYVAWGVVMAFTGTCASNAANVGAHGTDGVGVCVIERVAANAVADRRPVEIARVSARVPTCPTVDVAARAIADGFTRDSVRAVTRKPCAAQRAKSCSDKEYGVRSVNHGGLNFHASLGGLDFRERRPIVSGHESLHPQPAFVAVLGW